MDSLSYHQATKTGAPMSEDRKVIVIVCDDEETAEVLKNGLPDADSAKRVLRRENFDGSAATWMVVASSAISMLPKILEGVAKLIEALKVRSIKIGDREIKNPTPSDVRVMLKETGDS
jgi:hypothetical protein